MAHLTVHGVRQCRSWQTCLWGSLFVAVAHLCHILIFNIEYPFLAYDRAWRSCLIFVALFQALVLFSKRSMLKREVQDRRSWFDLLLNHGLSLILSIQLGGVFYNLASSGMHPLARAELILACGLCFVLPCSRWLVWMVLPMLLIAYGVVLLCFPEQGHHGRRDTLSFYLLALSSIGFLSWWIERQSSARIEEVASHYRHQAQTLQHRSTAMERLYQSAMASLKKSHGDKRQRERDLNYYEDLILDLAGENERKAEQERLELADQLHDTVKQSLAIAKLRCDTLVFDEGSCETVKLGLEGLSRSLDQAIRETREVVQQMSLKILDEFGLETGLEDLIEQYRNHHGMKLKYVYGASFKCSLVMGKHIYHSVQECLNNVLKHSSCLEASVVIEELKHQLCVSIKNPQSRLARVQKEERLGAGYGLFRMQQRCRQLGGTMMVDDSLTVYRVDMRLPISNIPKHTGDVDAEVDDC